MIKILTPICMDCGKRRKEGELPYVHDPLRVKHRCRDCYRKHCMIEDDID